MKNDNKDFVKIFDTIRFSDDALDCLSNRDDTTTYCFDDTTSCSLNKTSCSYKNDMTGSDSGSDPSKDKYSPEDISYWINFGHFRKK